MTTKHSFPQSGSQISRFFGYFFLFLLIGLACGSIAGYALYRQLVAQLPDIESLSEVRYQIPMSIYSKEGLLMAQYGEKKRSPVSYADVPKPIIQAFLAAEDNRFFDHPGIDYQGLLRASFTFLRTGEKKQGGSTITMQVARNFFLSSEKTFFRKINEILLAIKIESKLPKERILELYLNKIYFGHHAYGVVAAAQVYYGKSITQLGLDEIAMIAGLPKAPSAFNPIVNPTRALERRDYVLRRMATLGFIDEAAFRSALAQPVTATLHETPMQMDAPYFVEMVRDEMYSQFGEAAYTNGYRVHTTLDSHLQGLAEHAVRDGLHHYDERHGYKGTKQKIDMKKIRQPTEWDRQLAEIPSLGSTVPALVVSVKDMEADVYLGSGRTAQLDWSGIRWARRRINQNQQGAAPRSARGVLKSGDLIRLRQNGEGHWKLSEVPGAEAALVSLEPKTGAVLALVGGYDFARSKFNRASQALRQPGSGFKPILYAAALSEGYSPTSIVNDAPISYSDPSQDGGVWRPHNYSGRFYGPTPLRVALAKSRNLVSVRLLRDIGLPKAIDTALAFGFTPEELPNALPLALGAGIAAPMRMAQAYAAFANGGFRVDPYLIERIETEAGQVVYQATPPTTCIECDVSDHAQSVLARRAMSPQVHYMMHSMLRDVIRKGTAMEALELGRPDIAGKTGTTNEYRDAWFNGYAPGLVAVVWLGYDSYKPLGDGETGGKAALPIWIRYMREALKHIPVTEFPLPDGLTVVRSENDVVEVYPSRQKPRHARSPTPKNEQDASMGDEVSEIPESPEPRPRAAPEHKSIESLF